MPFRLAALASLLNGQRDGILSALPSSLSSFAGLGTLRDVGSRATAAAREVQPQGGLGWLWAALVGLLVALVGWALLSGRQTPEVAAPVGDAMRAANEAARQAGQAARISSQPVLLTLRFWG